MSYDIKEQAEALTREVLEASRDGIAKSHDHFLWAVGVCQRALASAMNASAANAELVEACGLALKNLCGGYRTLEPTDTEVDQNWGCCDASRAAFKIKRALAKIGVRP